MALFALSFVLLNYTLSVNQIKVAYPLLGVVIVELSLIAVFHSGIAQIVNMMLISAAVCFVAVLAFCLISGWIRRHARELY